MCVSIFLCFPPSAPQAPAHTCGCVFGENRLERHGVARCVGPQRAPAKGALASLFYAMRYAMFRDMVPEYVIPKMLNQSAANPIADPIPTVTVLFVLIADFNQYTRTMVHKVLNILQEWGQVPLHNPTWCPSKGKQEELLETQVAQTCFRHRTLVCPRGQLRS